MPPTVSARRKYWETLALVGDAEHAVTASQLQQGKRYFGEEGMLGYVKQVQREEIRQGIACVKHQNMAGSDIGDDHKEAFAGEAALKAGGENNTMNQFAA